MIHIKKLPPTGNKKSENLLFVIQKHDATSLHYDFRLQVGKVMPSWAVPKGPTLDPGVKRMAMKVDDHPMEWRNFEGVIPEGQYGAGPVMIWDEGTYLPEIEVSKGVREVVDNVKKGTEVMKKGLEKGEIKFQLFGKKLKGSFALVKTHGFGPKNAWLLIKHRDKFAKVGYDANDFDFSARTKRGIKIIAEEG